MQEKALVVGNKGQAMAVKVGLEVWVDKVDEVDQVVSIRKITQRPIRLKDG